MLDGLVFIKSGFFVNTSRVHPNSLIVELCRLKIAGTSHHAVGIMSDTITECFLLNEIVGGSVTVHKVMITPFEQEMQRDLSLLGKLFNFQVVTGSVSHYGISFLTRKRHVSFRF